MAHTRPLVAVVDLVALKTSDPELVELLAASGAVLDIIGTDAELLSPASP